MPHEMQVLRNRRFAPGCRNTELCASKQIWLSTHRAATAGFDPVRSKNSSEAPRLFTRPVDGNNARAHPVSRGIEPAPRDEYPYPEGTAKHCPFPDDSAQHGNVRHIRSVRVARSAHQREPPWTGTPPSPT